MTGSSPVPADFRPGAFEAVPDAAEVAAAVAVAAPAPLPQRHTVTEDVQGLILASLVSALGMSILATGGLMVGGVAGMALLAHYATGAHFGLLFVLFNLPFYWIAVRRMGWEFTLKTFLAVGVTGVVADLIPRMAPFESMTPLFSAVFGGALVGMGILSFIRHRASLGGVGIVVVWLQRSRGWSAGKLQLGFDTVLMLVSLTVLPPSKVLYSALGVLVLNLVLLFNHRPGRYMGA
ncbi:YitT family protein [Luteimonas sp. S4-F44]|uniref:YitT family protein n=1 Tax=Luteimonas sp. S4-F44 TaxID=2925842 RepID=UPI001F52B5CB|nr:YitT family protein [Luteimonas sp. S4-F44]UNK42651.1 YitT family protein [Luteimonas sp. S4-F44]